MLAIPCSLALSVLQFERHSIDVDDAFMLGNEDDHHGLRVFHRDGTDETLMTIDDLYAYWARTGFRPRGRA